MATHFCSPKAYTRVGDKGTTCLCCLPKKIGKADLRIEAIGSIDETNSFVGLCRANCKGKNIDKILEKVQNNLFRIGAEIANRRAGYKNKIDARDLKDLENTIDKIHVRLPERRHFIFPRGGLLASHLHVARTVCRRAERRVVALNERSRQNPELLRYVNRLSSLLFVLARQANKSKGIKEVEWLG